MGWGYWTLNIVGANTRGTKLVPLYGRLFSHAVEGHESENEEIRDAIGEVAEAVGRRGIWVMFVKQSYRLEDLRCLTYHRLQALMVLVTAAAYFTAVYLGLRMKLRVLAGQVLRASKRVFGIPDFRLYALADGIRQFLYSQTQRLKKSLELQSPEPIQPKLFDP